MRKMTLEVGKALILSKTIKRLCFKSVYMYVPRHTSSIPILTHRNDAQMILKKKLI